MKRLLPSLLLAVACLFAFPAVKAATPYGTQAVRIPNITLLTAASPADLATVSIDLNRYIVTAVYVESMSAAGTLAAATIDIRTATAGGGASVLNAATALTGLTAANLVQAPAVATLGAALTAANLTLRQTVNSGNAGVVSLVIIVIPLPE